MTILMLACLQACCASGQVVSKVRYTLLGPSFLADECLICGRPTIQEPLRGTFDLLLKQDIPPFTRYFVENVQFTSSAGTSLEKILTGEGAYQRLEEFALTQDLTLALEVASDGFNESAFFTNATPIVGKPFPLIQATLVQTNGNFLHTLTIQILAAPVHEIWFSLSQPLTSTNFQFPTNVFSPGDLVSSTGRVIKRNEDLLGRLGVMPPVPDLGLDSVDLAAGGEVLFSVPADVFSETLGPIQHGDLLSNRGKIVRRNQDLLSAFHLNATNDAGLDAFQVMPSGEILFSVQSNVVINGKLTLSRGDILSDHGQLFLAHQELLARFHPTVTNYDFGLAALRVFPSGEIWFSVEEGFTDNNLGNIQPGDLLSSLGYKVFSNQDLVASLGPDKPLIDYGLDALWVVTDTAPTKMPPPVLQPNLAGGMLHLSWNGAGDVFQVEQAPSPAGPWAPASGISPDPSWSTAADTSAGGSVFFRVHQW